MKLLNLYLTLIVALISTNIFADGPPIDKNGNITEDHIVVILSKDQLKQVGRHRVLTLTDEQYETLRKICNVFPKKIWAITPHWKLCTCEKIYCIWNKRNQVGIPHKVVNYACDLGQSFVRHHNELIESTLSMESLPSSSFWKPLVKDKSWCVTLTMDYQGKIYCAGRIIGIDDIEKGLSESPESIGRFKNTVFLSPPPFIDKETDKKIKILIDQVRNSAFKKGINVEIGLSH